MQHYFAFFTIVLLVVIVIIRIALMRKHGINAFLFGKIDKKDFLIPPFVLFYFYQIFSAAFILPSISKHQFFYSEIISWIGVFFCLTGLILFLLSIISFGSNFRVGIDVHHSNILVTTGIFAVSRNPIYVAFWVVLFGQFLIFPTWIFLVYLCAATWLFHRQVLLEEIFLEEYFGQEYADYCAHVKRYI